MSIDALATQIKRLAGSRRRPTFFSAAGVNRRELPQSDFLRFLLDPSEKHGLGDAFLKRFLQRSLAGHPVPNISWWADLLSTDLKDTVVERETNHIDLLIVNKRRRFAIIIENKIDSKEHSDQLARYWKTVSQNYGFANQCLGLFLTPNRVAPSDDRYLAVSYGSVCKAGEQVLRENAGIMNQRARELIVEFVRHIREEYMGDPHSCAVAWNIHRQFSEELDFIASHPPMSQVHQQVESMIRETASQKKEIEWEDSERDNICFILPEWHRRPPTADLPKQTGYRSFLLFWFEDFEDSVTLYFGVADQSPFLREKMTQMLSASEKGWGQQHAVVHTSDGWNQIWSRRFLGSFDEIRHLEREEVFNRLQDRWNWFLEKDLPKFRRGIALALSGVL